MSTDGSGEDQSGPGSTLSYHIVSFHLSGHVLYRLAMINRLIGLIEALARTAGSNVVA